jgi:hypothetical protein
MATTKDFSTEEDEKKKPTARGWRSAAMTVLSRFFTWSATRSLPVTQPTQVIVWVRACWWLLFSSFSHLLTGYNFLSYHALPYAGESETHGCFFKVPKERVKTTNNNRFCVLCVDGATQRPCGKKNCAVRGDLLLLLFLSRGRD